MKNKILEFFAVDTKIKIAVLENGESIYLYKNDVIYIWDKLQNIKNKYKYLDRYLGNTLKNKLKIEYFSKESLEKYYDFLKIEMDLIYHDINYDNIYTILKEELAIDYNLLNTREYDLDLICIDSYYELSDLFRKELNELSNILYKLKEKILKVYREYFYFYEILNGATSYIDYLLKNNFSLEEFDLNKLKK
ncbi:MAG: hypothetical protein PHI37_00605 [Candidatus Gracilibacteria bacterium]|nr:hypothetical protein [Candidatus Gracilibacteria bacterium]